jgi:hypothetical protein
VLLSTLGLLPVSPSLLTYPSLGWSCLGECALRRESEEQGRKSKDPFGFSRERKLCMRAKAMLGGCQARQER